MKRIFVPLFITAICLLFVVSCIDDITPPVSPIETPVSPLPTPAVQGRQDSITFKEESAVNFWQAVVDFFYGSMLPTILGLVALDVVFGVAASLKDGAFDWGKVAQFYKTMIAPYVLVYLAVFVALALVPELEEYVTVVGISVATLFGSVTANLLASIVKNVTKLGVGGTL